MNLLTLGLGRLSRAVRLREREVGIDELLGGLAAAQDLFRAVLVVVGPLSERTSLHAGATAPRAATTLSWRRYLSEQPRADGMRLVQLLESVVAQGQQLGETVIGDGDLVTVRECLRAVEQGIRDVRLHVIASLIALEGKDRG